MPAARTAKQRAASRRNLEKARAARKASAKRAISREKSWAKEQRKFGTAIKSSGAKRKPDWATVYVGRRKVKVDMNWSGPVDVATPHNESPLQLRALAAAVQGRLAGKHNPYYIKPVGRKKRRKVNPNALAHVIG